MIMRCSSLGRSFHTILCAVLVTALTVSLSTMPSSGAASRVSISRVSTARSQPIRSSSSLDWAFAKYLGDRSGTAIDYLNNLDWNTDKSFEYGFDPDGVTFARKADGTKARYVALSPDHVKLEISKQGELGNVEIQRYPSDRRYCVFKLREVVACSCGHGLTQIARIQTKRESSFCTENIRPNLKWTAKVRKGRSPPKQ